MRSLTGSIRLVDERAGLVSTATFETEPSFFGLEAAAGLAQALKRPARPVRTAAERLEEERLNVITHGVGLAISAAGLVYLLSVGVAGNWLQTAGCGVYGASLVLMYASSTLFHATQTPHLKLRFQLLDHVAIYLLIAGTYTAFFGGLLQGQVGFTLVACVWVLAAVGIAIKIKNSTRLQDTSPLPCVALGWLGVAAMKPLLAVLPVVGMALLLGGGISFSVGVIFYCRDDRRYFHAIWHLFVIAGTTSHFCAILLCVAK